MKALTALIVIGFLVFVGDSYSADNANQSITYEVQGINEIFVSGNPSPLIINFAVPGFQPSSELDVSTTYSLTTNGSNKKITGSIDSAMPSNSQLLISLTAPTGASSAGWVTLSTTAANLITSISTLAESGLTISYRLNALTSAGIIASSQKTVTMTIVDAS